MVKIVDLENSNSKKKTVDTNLWIGRNPEGWYYFRLTRKNPRENRIGHSNTLNGILRILDKILPKRLGVMTYIKAYRAGDTLVKEYTKRVQNEILETRKYKPATRMNYHGFDWPVGKDGTCEE